MVGGRRRLGWRGAALAVLALVPVLAGCIGGAGPGAGTDLGMAGSTGILAGSVVDNEYRPVDGANVTLEDVDGVAATVGSSGRFNLTLPGGAYFVTIEALGFFRLRQAVEVRSGQATEAQFILEPTPSTAPYTSIVTLSGYSTCDISLFVSVTTFDNATGQPCPLGNPKRSVITEVGDSWMYAAVEMTWQTEDAFALYVADDINCLTSDPCYAIKFSGNAPVRVDVAPEDAELAAEWASDGQAMAPAGAWTLYANALYIGKFREQWGGLTDEPVCRGALSYKPGCPSVGVSTGIKFDTYVSIFNWERPANPAAHTALPDQ